MNVRERLLAGSQPNWWDAALRGAAALLSGLILSFWLVSNPRLLFGVFGAYMAIDGLIEIGGALRKLRQHEKPWHALISGATGVVFGLSNIAGLGMSPADRVLTVAARSTMGGISGILTARRLRADQLTKRLVLIGGIGGVCLGILLVAVRVEVGALALIRLLGVFTVLLGVLFWWIAMRLNGLVHRAVSPTQAVR